VAVDLLNSRVLPFYEDNRLPLYSILTDRGREFCGPREEHLYELYLDAEGISHVKSQTKDPQGNCICASFHRMILKEFYEVAFRRKRYKNMAALQADLDEWIDGFNARGMEGACRRADRRMGWG
jgi:hypothetical protein